MSPKPMPPEPDEHVPASAPMSAGFNPVHFTRGLIRNSPWVVIAFVVHVILISVLSVVYMTQHDEAADQQIPTVGIAAQKQKDQDNVVQPPEVIGRKAVPKNVDAEVVTMEQDVFIPSTDAQEDLTKERGDPNALDNLPSDGFTG